MNEKLHFDQQCVVPESTVESQFLEPPRETEIGSRKREAREIESKITEKFIQGKRKLVREIGKFEKSRVREIGLPRYSYSLHGRSLEIPRGRGS